LEKVAQTVAKPKIAKISTSKLNLKIQNIFLKNENTCKNATLLLLYLGENVKKFAWAKSSPKCYHFFGLLFKKS
jgi:hypothetical protein